MKRPKKEKEHKPINWPIVLTWTVGVLGALIMGFGMSKIMVENASSSDMVLGLATGIIGLVICVLNPLHQCSRKGKVIWKKRKSLNSVIS